ncbi:MAG TPA: tetratricopeptide repeat protein [Drouetiella sp.]
MFNSHNSRQRQQAELRQKLHAERLEILKDRMIERAITSNDPALHFQAGLLFGPANRDNEKAMFWLQRASDGGDPHAKFCIASAAIMTENPVLAKAAYPLLISASKAGLPEADLLLGRLFARGLGVDTNLDKAYEFYLSAAANGVREAQFLLGVHYLDKDHHRYDPPMAVYWLNAAAQLGDTNAQSLLADMYEQGDLVPQDISRAEKYRVMLANKLSDAESKFEMVMRYCRGEGVPVDYQKAAHWLEETALVNDSSCLSDLAMVSILNKRILGKSIRNAKHRKGGPLRHKSQIALTDFRRKHNV